MIKIFGFLKSDSGCDWYRIKQPLIHLRASKKAEVRFFHKGDDFDWFGSDEAAEHMDRDLSWADIIFVPRISEVRLMKVLNEFKKLGKKIVTEWDDNLFKVSPLTMQYAEFGTEEHNFKTDTGEILEGWKDGKNIQIERNKQTIAMIKQSLRDSDMVITTTEDLAEVFKPYNSNIKVCPNSVNINLWKKLPLLPHQGIRMGWFGGDTHFEDFTLVAPILKSFMDQNPAVTLVLLGGRFDATLKGIDPARIEHHNWTDINAYPYKASILDLDFAIIPLVDNDFNNGKSPIKWLEMAALEVPAVTSYVRPYDKMMDLVKDNGIFVEANSMQGWWDSLNLMAKNPELRKRMGVAARQTVEQFYDANKTYEMWLQAFESVMERKLEVV